MGCNQSQDQQTQQQQQQKQQFNFPQQPIQGYGGIGRFEQEKQKSRSNEENQVKQVQNNNKTLQKEKKDDSYQLMRKQSILKKTQKIIQENLLCSQQLQSNQALSTRRHYKADKESQLQETNKFQTQNDYFTYVKEYDDNCDSQDKENVNSNVQYYQQQQQQYQQQYTTTEQWDTLEKSQQTNQISNKQKGAQTIADKINEHLRQFSSGCRSSSSNDKQPIKRQSQITRDQGNVYQQKINGDGDTQQDILTSKHCAQKAIQKVHQTKPKKLISETQTIAKIEQNYKVHKVEVAEQQQNQVLNFQNKLHLLTMRKYSSSGSSQNTSYQKITQRYNQLSQNSSYIFNQSNSLFNFRTGKTHEQCRLLYSEIESIVKARCPPNQYDAYHRFNALIDKITSKNGEIKVNIVTDTSFSAPPTNYSSFSSPTTFSLSSKTQIQQKQNGSKNQGGCLIQKIQNEIVNFEQFDLIETYLNDNCISYDRRFFAKCVANMKQLTSLITQINFVFNNYNNNNTSQTMSTTQSSQFSNNYKSNNKNNQNKIDECFSIEIKIQRPFEEEQLNALSKQHSEYENIYEWYKINQASALGYGFVVNSSFKDEIYTFYIYHEDKNVNLQKALSAFSMYGASMHPSVQQNLEMIIPCNDFDLDFHFNQFGLVSIKLNLGKLSPNCQTQLLNLYHTHIANCGSVKQFRGIDHRNQSISNASKQSMDYQQNLKQSYSRNTSSKSNCITSSTASSSQSSRSNQNGRFELNKDVLSPNPINYNNSNLFQNNNLNQLYMIEFNKQGFNLSKSEQIGQDDSASNTQIFICEQFK